MSKTRVERKIVNPVIKDTTNFIRTVLETGGKLTEVEVTLMPGGGTPIHFHKHFSESFTAVKGRLGLRIEGGKTIILQPGESYTIPIGTGHNFHNPTREEIKFNVLIEPGNRGFEQSLQILYGLATDGLTDKKALPRKLAHTAIIMSLGDMNATGLLSLVTPLLEWIARRERKKGTEQALIRRYCKW